MNSLDRCYNISDLRKLAQRRLPKGIFEFIDRGSEDELGLRRNREAFERLTLRTKFLVDLSKRDLGTTLLGKRSELPLAIAPTGVAGLCWDKGELVLAKAAAAAGIPFSLSSGSVTSMETIARGAGGRLWFQLFLWRETHHSFEMVKRAKDLGYEALIVTIDNALGRAREHNARNGFSIPFRPNPTAVGHVMMKPRWLANVFLRYCVENGLPHHANYPKQYQHMIRFRPGGGEPPRHEGMTWDDISRLRDLWPGMFIVKSTLTGHDADEAVKRGANAVVVSNHGGRAMDSAAATIDMLPEVVAAVNGRAKVLLDSGVRRGSDIAKAVALGAEGVLIGRPTLYGIASGGEAGASKAIGILRTELEKTMGYLGCRTIAEIDNSVFAEPAVAGRSNGTALQP